MRKESIAKRNLIISMFIFGTIGIFRKYIPISSSMLAFFRGLLGTLFVYLYVKIKKIPSNKEAIKKNLILLVVSGCLIGLNWALLFESFNYTSVSIGTLCYYMAPVMIIIASPFVLKEKLTIKKVFCVFLALVGICLISGVFNEKIYGIKGIIFGLSAAFLYAIIVLINKFIKDINAYDKTMIQLLFAGLILIPIVLSRETFTVEMFTLKTILLILFVGIFITGVTYTLYFGSVTYISSQSIAILSYIDPVVSILLSALILKERMNLAEIIGAILILGSTIVSEINISKKEKSQL